MKFLKLVPQFFAVAFVVASAGRSSAAPIELISDGMFVTTPGVPASNGTAYSQNVASFGTTPAGYQYQLTQTVSGNAGWVTNEPNNQGVNQMEVWQPGANASPVNATNSNTLELADYTGGNYVRQSVTSTLTNGAYGSFSFGYFARTGAASNAFSVTITDVTHAATLLNQAFNQTTTNVEASYKALVPITPGDVYLITYTDGNAASSSEGAHIDNVSFMQVPEPGTWWCMALAGVLTLVVWRRSAVRA